MSGDDPHREDRGFAAGLFVAFREAFQSEPDNPVVSAWLLEGSRKPRARRWPSHVLGPFIATGVLLVTIAYMGLRSVPSQPVVPGPAAYGHFARLLPVWSLCWAWPLIYTALRDALSALGRHHAAVGGWHGLLNQLRDAPVSDVRMLAALLRITWPRLLLATWGSAVLFWLLMLCCAWPVSDLHWNYTDGGDLFNGLLARGWLIILLLGINGSLGALIAVLTCINLGRGLPGFIAPGVGAALACGTFSLLAAASLNADHWPRGYHLPLNHIIPAIAGVLAVWGMVLLLADRVGMLRRGLALLWTAVLGALAWVISFGVEFLHPVGPQSAQELYSFIWLQASWLTSTQGLLNPGIYPGIFEVSGQAAVMQLADNLDQWSFTAGYCCVIGFQLMLAAALVPAALSAVGNWRRGEL